MRRGLQMFRAIFFKLTWSGLCLLLVLFFAKAWQKKHRAQPKMLAVKHAPHAVRAR